METLIDETNFQADKMKNKTEKVQNKNLKVSKTC